MGNLEQVGQCIVNHAAGLLSGGGLQNAGEGDVCGGEAGGVTGDLF